MIDAKDFRELENLALAMIADPCLVGKTWEQVVIAQRLNRYDRADGDTFCSVMHSSWIYANLAALILAEDYTGLRAFIERVDPNGTVRKDIRDAKALRRGVT